MKRQIDIYLRRKDGIYVIPYGITTQGFSYQTEPFEHLPSGSSEEEIWIAVTKALQNTNRRVPHPEAWGEETAWYRKAGVKTWSQFVSKSDAISVIETEQEYIFNNLYLDRGGFTGRNETKFGIPKSSSHDEIIAALKKCLEAINE